MGIIMREERLEPQGSDTRREQRPSLQASSISRPIVDSTGASSPGRNDAQATRILAGQHHEYRVVEAA
jgi:hypothetical protein